MLKGQHWDGPALAGALKASEEAASGALSAELSGEDQNSIRVRLHACGDLDVVVAVIRPAILASVVLCRTDEIDRRADFERALLRAHKVIPLSTFAITTVAGEEYYEIFGQLSTGSEIEEIIEEIETLGRNAIQAAEMIDRWKKGA